MSSICSPKVIPQPDQDCLDLHQAVEGLGFDVSVVISILAHRNAHQRSQIKAVYQRMYHEDICKRLKSVLHFHFEKAMLMWMRDPPERDAMLLKDALGSSNSMRQNQIITEVLSTRSMDELDAITKAYSHLYGRPLQKDLAASVTGLPQKLFVQYLDGTREEAVQLEPYFSLEEARKLHHALATSVDEAAFLQIMTTRTREQLRSIFDAYKTTYGHHVYEDLKQKGTTESHKVLKIFSRCISAPEDYFAKVLYKSMKGLGTDDDTLIRVVVTCAEVNMATIKVAFFRMYKKVLSDMIASDTTGSYRKFLFALIGAPN